MRNYEESVKANDNPNQLGISDYLYKILKIGCSGPQQTNILLNLIKHQQPDTDKINFYFKDPFESKNQLLINEREMVEMKELKNPKSFFCYSQTIDDVYENFEDYNPTEKRKVLLVFDDMLADMEANTNSSPIVNELF